MYNGFSWLYAAAPFLFSLIPVLEIGIPDYVLGVVMMINTYLFRSQHEHYIRIGQFALISPGWIWYNALNGSIPGVLTECLNMVSVVIYYLRGFWKKQNKAKE